MRPLGGPLPVFLFLAAALACRPAVGPAPLAPVPRPDLAATEAPVRRQLESRRAAADELLSRRGEVPEADLARAFGELGRLYHAYGLADAAAPCYANARALAPGEFRWAYYEGVLRQSNGDFDGAAASFGAALAIRGRDLPTLVRLGDVELARDRPDQASRRFAEAAAIEDVAAVHAGLGRAALARGELEEAAAELRRALELAPGADRLHYLLAQVHRKGGDRRAAERELAASGEVEVSYPDPLLAELLAEAAGSAVHLERAAAAAGDGLYDLAEREYRQALAVDPTSGAALQGLAAVVARTGDLAGAVALYRRALAAQPDDVRIHYRLGLLLEKTGDFAEAVGHLERALARDPGLPRAARLALARCLEGAGRREEALATFDRLLADEPEAADARYAKALTLARAGRPAEAAGELARVVASEPGNLHARLDLGTALAQSGRRSDAEERFRGVLEAPAASAEERALAAFGLAEMARVQGRPEEALRHLQRAVELDPVLVPARARYAVQLAAAGRPAEAAEAAAAVAEILASHGRGSEARTWRRRAVELARRSGDRALADRLEGEIDRARRAAPGSGP